MVVNAVSANYASRDSDQSVNLSYRIEPIQGQRKTLIRVRIESTTS